jgi:2-methylcitrate dehydratase PrpD
MIDQLRDKMHVKENKTYSRDYLDPNKRSITNSIQLEFKDGTSSEKVEIHFPIGHRMRRDEGFSLLEQKLHQAIKSFFGENASIQENDLKQSLADPASNVASFLTLCSKTAQDE